MNRRRFLQSLAAMFSLPAAPAMSLGSATSALPAAAAVPTQARFWAIYTSALHGECTPQTLQNMLNIPEVDAKRYVSQLIGDGVIKPNPLLKQSAAKVLKSSEDTVFDKVKKRAEMKRQAASSELEFDQVTDEEALDDEPELLDDFSETGADEEHLIEESEPEPESKSA